MKNWNTKFGDIFWLQLLTLFLCKSKVSVLFSILHKLFSYADKSKVHTTCLDSNHLVCWILSCFIQGLEHNDSCQDTFILSLYRTSVFVTGLFVPVKLQDFNVCYVYLSLSNYRTSMFVTGLFVNVKLKLPDFNVCYRPICHCHITGLQCLLQAYLSLSDYRFYCLFAGHFYTVILQNRTIMFDAGQFFYSILNITVLLCLI